MSFQLPMPQPSSGGEFPYVQLGGYDPGGRHYLHFTLRHVNWLAHAFQRSPFVPNQQEYREFLDVLYLYLLRLEATRSRQMVRMAKDSLEDLYFHGREYEEISSRLRHRFNSVPWRALILPGGIMRGPESGTDVQRLDLEGLTEKMRRLGVERLISKKGGREKKASPEKGTTVPGASELDFMNEVALWAQRAREAARTLAEILASGRDDQKLKDEISRPVSADEIAEARLLTLRALERMKELPSLDPEGALQDSLLGSMFRNQQEVRERKYEKNMQVGGADELLTSERIFNDQYDVGSAPPYLIFQLGMPAGELIYLEDIFPALTLAFA